MGEFKGTKGKWQLLKTKSHPEEENHFWSVIQTHKIAFDIINTDSISFIESKSNALLISKAPEMLEMLKDIIDLFEDGSLKSVDPIKRLIKEATEL